MAIVIEDPKVDEAVRELAAATGEPLEVSIHHAVQEKLDRLSQRKGRELLERIRPLLDRVAEMPVLDDRTDDEIIGYNEQGAFD